MAYHFQQKSLFLFPIALPCFLSHDYRIYCPIGRGFNKFGDFVDKRPLVAGLALLFTVVGGGYSLAQFAKYVGGKTGENDQKKIERCVPNETPPALRR